MNGPQKPNSVRQWARTFVRAGLVGSALLAATGAGVTGYAVLHEPFNIELERLTVRLPNAAGRVPPGGLRILHLSDTHFMGRNRREHRKIARIRELTAGLDYDVLIHTGDFWHYEHGLANVLSLLNVLPRPRLASLAVLGNHDYTHYAMSEALPIMWRRFQTREAARRGERPLSPLAYPTHVARFVRYVRETPVDGRRSGSNDAGRLGKVLQARGFQILHNQSVHLCDDACGLDVFFAGVDDVVEGRPRIHHALDRVPPEAPTILLSHNPDILASPRIGQVDLVLSGHTHGGQIVLPLWGPAHTQAVELGRHEVAGFFRRGDTQVYITRGLGEGIPLRLGARPQFALITVTG
jgi:predicted MPP superfamily phosphohydrolase